LKDQTHPALSLPAEPSGATSLSYQPDSVCQIRHAVAAEATRPSDQRTDPGDKPQSYRLEPESELRSQALRARAPRGNPDRRHTVLSNLFVDCVARPGVGNLPAQPHRLAATREYITRMRCRRQTRPSPGVSQPRA